MKPAITQFCLYSLSLLISINSYAQKKKIPEVLSNIKYDNKGYYFELKGNKYYAKSDSDGFIPEMFTDYIRGTVDGINLISGQKV